MITKKFKVLPRLGVSCYELDEPHLVISIRNPGTLPAVYMNPNIKERLYLEFDDAEQDDPNSYAEQVYREQGVAPNYFNEIYAQQIVDLVKRYPEINYYVVNCEMGISRSAGVAAAISKHFNGEDDFFFENYIPNKFVYKILLKELEK